jgi:hypothetical protein
MSPGAVSNETITNSTAPLVVGHWLQGNVQDLAVYKTALTPAQVASHYQAGTGQTPPPPTTCSPSTAYSKLIAGTGGIAGYWRLADPPGSASACASVGSNAGSYSGGVKLGQSGAIAGDPATSASFDGSGTASVPDSAALDSGDTFSVEAWVKRASVSNYNQLIADKQSGSWALIFNAGDQLVLRRSGYDSIAWSWQRVRDTSSWHYVAATKSGSSVHLYIDGNDVTGAVSNDTITNSSDPLVIGHWLQGNVQDVAVYENVLTPSQISSHYQAGAGHAPTPTTGGKGATLGNLAVVGGGVPVIAAAGDISCSPGDADWSGGAGDANGCQEAATANLMSGGQLNGSNLSAVLPLGDEQYEGGATAEFAAGYGPTWGALKSISYPVPGEHDYFTPAGADYYDFFNGPGVVSGRAGNEGAGYYSFNLGGWHIVALNSECELLPGGCGAGSPEETWLKHDLSADSAHCTLAYWNQPVFYSGSETGGEAMKQMFTDLYNAHATLVLNGHEHQYERFAPQNANGQSDPTHGIVEIVDGTGGRSLEQFGTVAPNSLVRNNTTYGVLELTLLATSYNFRFVPAAGGSFTDAGSGPCRN